MYATEDVRHSMTSIDQLIAKRKHFQSSSLIRPDFSLFENVLCFVRGIDGSYSTRLRNKLQKVCCVYFRAVPRFFRALITRRIPFYIAIATIDQNVPGYNSIRLIAVPSVLYRPVRLLLLEQRQECARVQGDSRVRLVIASL